MLSISFAVSFKLAISKIYPPMSLSRSMTFAMRSILAAPAIKNRSISSWSLALFRGNDLSSSMQTRSAASPSLFISRLAFGDINNEHTCKQSICGVAAGCQNSCNALPKITCPHNSEHPGQICHKKNYPCIMMLCLCRSELNSFCLVLVF